MSYKYRIVNDRPTNFFPLEPAPNDFIGEMGGVRATVSGSPVPAPPLVVGGGAAYEVNGTNNFRFPSVAFYLRSPQEPFSLEAWFKPISVSSPKGILGHTGQADGLAFDGEKITFSTWHGDAGRCTAEYFPRSTTGSFHVVGLHTGQKNELYVNGDMVASVDLTNEQLNTPYEISANPGSLHVGSLPGTIIVDAVAVYKTGLTARQIRQHFVWGREVADYRTTATYRGATYWSFSDDTATIGFDFKFDSAGEWNRGEFAQISLQGDILVPEFDGNGVSLEGTWTAGGIIASLGNNINGSKIEWDADGPVRVQTSLNNGVNWENPVNGRMVPGLREGYTTGDRALIFRVIFPAGEPEDTITKLRSLSIRLYTDQNARANIGGPKFNIVGDAGLSTEVFQPIEQQDQFGIEFYNGGYGVISSVDGYRTIEAWVKANEPQTTQWWHVFDFRASAGGDPGLIARQHPTGDWYFRGGVMYVNGKRTSSNADFPLTPGRWYHVVFVIDANHTTPMYLNTNYVKDPGRAMSYGMLALYPQVMTDAEVTELYRAQMGITSHKIVDPTGLAISDSVDAVKIYTHNWTLSGSG